MSDPAVRPLRCHDAGRCFGMLGRLRGSVKLRLRDRRLGACAVRSQLVPSTWHPETLCSARSKVMIHSYWQLMKSRCYYWIIISLSEASDCFLTKETTVLIISALFLLQTNALPIYLFICLFFYINSTCQTVHTLHCLFCNSVDVWDGDDRAVSMENVCIFNRSSVNVRVPTPLPVCVMNLQSDGEMVTDTNPHLASCCELLELVLRKGLQRQYPHNMCSPS